jgi:chromosome segregation ATPase
LVEEARKAVAEARKEGVEHGYIPVAFLDALATALSECRDVACKRSAALKGQIAETERLVLLLSEELYDIEDEGRMLEYVRRSPESAAADLSSLIALLSKAERQLEDALEAGRALEEQRNVAVREVERQAERLATALSECRERERTACEALRDIAYPDNWPDLKEYPSALDTWMQTVAASTLTALAAQPPSKASET